MHPLLILVIGLGALALRLAVPAGFMPALDHGRLALTPCTGLASSVAIIPPATTGPLAGTTHHEQGNDQARGSCAFADLSLPALGSTAPAALATAIVFPAFTKLFLRSERPDVAALRLRPPLRGPPLTR